MPKGQLCPLCKTHTAQYISANRFKCSRCDTVYTRETLLAGRP